MALVGLKEGFNLGRRSFLNVRSGSPFKAINLGFGAGSDFPAVSGKARGHVYSYVDSLSPSTSQAVQLTRDNTNVRGFHTGEIRIGFRKTDIEPPFDATADPFKLTNGILFCYVQEVNDYPVGSAPADKTPSTLVPDPLNDLTTDKLQGLFALVFSINYFNDQINLQLRCEGRLPQFGGGVLSPSFADGTRTLSPGDFIGVMLRWESSVAPSETGFASEDDKPIVMLKGYTALQEDFSDAKLWIAAQFDFSPEPITLEPPFILDPFQLTQRGLWNIWGSNYVIRDPLCEGASWSTFNGHGYVCEYLETFDGT